VDARDRIGYFFAFVHGEAPFQNAPGAIGRGFDNSAPKLMSGHIFTTAFSYGNEMGSKKDKKGQKRQKA